MIISAIAGGCVSEQTVSRRPLTRTPSTDNALDRMLNSGHGLLVRKWVVTDNTERIGRALMHYQDGVLLEPELSRRLRRDGLRLLRVRADQLADLLGELGVGASDVTAWHGQILE